ncbi:MAG: hypothetical protein ACR2GK_05270 [Gemmatimonadaceae bacterium]
MVGFFKALTDSGYIRDSTITILERNSAGRRARAVAHHERVSAAGLLMATLRRPQLLLLDEHTAALDPRAADQITRITDQVVREHSLTTLMVTHSMDQALEQGDRTIMVHRGEILADLSGDERRGLSVDDLLRRFTELRYTVEFAVAGRA